MKVKNIQLYLIAATMRANFDIDFNEFNFYFVMFT